MRRIRTLAATLAIPLLLLAGCRTATQPDVTQPVTGPSTPIPIPSGAATLDPQLPDDGPPGVLAAIHTQQFADHDRIVFQFHGLTPPEATIRYASRITEDPSDKPVPLLGKTFVAVVFHGARLDTAALESDPGKIVRYTGPTRLTPRYPVLQQLAVSGDFEAVLSFGLGLSVVAGLSKSTPAGSASVILDLWRTAPDTLLWPSTSATQAGWLQKLVDNGNHLWMLNANDVASLYTQNVLGWPQGTVQAVDGHVFQVAGNSGFWAIITLTQPLGRAHTVWTVASVVESTQEPYIP